MLRNTVEELLLVHDGRVEEYNEDLATYEKWILGSFNTGSSEAAPSGDNSRREKRQQAAAARARLKPMRQQLKSVENEMESLEVALEAMETRLASADLYEAQARDELAALVQSQGEMKSRSAALEEQWLELQQTIEDLSD
jgi:ATP-binding cassette subfamily F protein 3